MAREQLFEFNHDNKTVKVFTGESSSDVYYTIGGGSTKNAKLKYKADTGTFSASGVTKTFDQAKQYIRNKL